jgi:hypothetical protein
MFMYNLCPIFPVLAVRTVTIAFILVINGVAEFLSLPEYTVILNIGL